MLTGISAEVRQGYTGVDHMIRPSDRAAANAAVAGRTFRRSADAHKAARAAYVASCDPHPRVRLARVVVTLRNARGEVVHVG